jgi:hypothetical protein
LKSLNAHHSASKITNRVLRFLGGALVSTAAIACSHTPRSSMVDYSTLVAKRQAVFYAHDRTLVLETRDPSGLVLVSYDPYVEDDRIVVTAGIASGGSGGVRWRCLDIGALGVEGDWTQRLVWRQRDGTLVPITDVNRTPRAQEVAAQCAPNR